MTPMTTIGVLLADDHPVVADGLARFLAGLPDIRVCGTASNLSEVMEKVQTLRPSVVVLDLDMPGMQGADSVRDIVATTGARLVMFSMHDEDELAVALLRARARAYLSKSRDPRQLAEAIRVVGSGRRYITPEISELMLTGRSQPPVHESFSRRERQVFDRIARGLAPKDIAVELELSPSTVHTYSERIKTKLGVESLTQVVSYAYREHLIA